MMRYGNGTFSKNSGSNPVTCSFGQGHLGPSEGLGTVEVRKMFFLSLLNCLFFLKRVGQIR